MERLPARVREKLAQAERRPERRHGLLLAMLLVLIAASGFLVLWRAMSLRQDAEGHAAAISDSPVAPAAGEDSTTGRIP